MDRLLKTFWAYLEIYSVRILPTLVIGIIIEVVFLFILKKSVKYKEKPVWTVTCGTFLSLAIAAIIVMTLYDRIPGTKYSFRLQLFGSYIESFRERDVETLLQIIMNIVMFVPVGLFLPCCFRKFERNRFVLLGAFFLSGAIEVIQGITKIGMFEFDDVLGNVLGAEIGFGIYWILGKIFRKVKLGRRGNSNEKNRS